MRGTKGTVMRKNECPKCELGMIFDLSIEDVSAETRDSMAPIRYGTWFKILSKCLCCGFEFFRIKNAVDISSVW